MGRILSSLCSVIFFAFFTIAPVPAEEEHDCKGKPADIVFVLDESGSIWGPDFYDRQLVFVKNLTDIFDIAANRTQVSVITFADKVRDHFPLNRYRSKDQLKSATSAIVQSRGGTATYDAIKYMRETSFSDEHGARNDVIHIGIIITDGESANQTRTIKQAKLAKDDGIKLFAIGVGDRIVHDELRAIASEPTNEYYFNVTGYDALDTIKNDLAIRACIQTTIPPPTTTTTTQPTTTLPQMMEGCRGLYTVDAVFALSDITRPRATEYALDFIKSLANESEISGEKMRFGVAPQTCKGVDGIKLNQCETKSDLLSELETQKPCGSHPEVALRILRTNSFSAAEGARSTAVKFGIVFVDDKLADVQKATIESEYAKENMQLIFIGVGGSVLADEDDLKQMATSHDHFFHVNRYSNLKDLKHNIKELFCLGVQNGGRYRASLVDFF